jgi:serine protease Do
MEDLIMLDAIERFTKGEMQQEELHHFEAMRTSNPELDQQVVEHIYFLKQMEQFADRKHFKSQLETIHTDLIHNKEIELTKETKVISLFDKYRKKLAVAATIAALFTVGAIGIMFAYKKGKNDNSFTVLNKKVASLDNKIDQVNNKLDASQHKPSIVASTSGTSFMVNQNGYLITNNHVVQGNNKVYVYNEKYGDLEAEVLLQDPTNDLAIIKIKDTAFKALKRLPYSFKNTETQLGQKVYTLGYSRPPGLVYNEGFISSRSANGSLQNKQNFLLTLQVEGGSSGSPILNNKGEIVGIVSAKEKMDNGFAVGVKPESIKNIMDVLNNRLEVKSKIFGVSNIASFDLNTQLKKIEEYIFMVKIK